MTDKSLLTLKEIARELGVNYRTVIDCKNLFSEYITFQLEGRKFKYPSKYVDFFRLIFALKDEGYSSNEIKRMLEDRSNRPTDYDGWIDGWLDGRMDVQMDGGMDRRTDGRMDGGMDVRTDGQTDTPGNNGLSKTFSDNSTIHQAKQEAVANAKEHTDQQLSKLRNEFTNSMVTLIAEANNVLTEYYKKIYHLEGIIEQIYFRLEKLEQNSGNSLGQEISLDEVEIEKFQIDPKSFGSNSGDRAGENNNPPSVDLDFVRNSITQGKPDKEAIIKWILSQRNKDYSYGDMASILNQAGVPTLRGKEGWSRGMVRNLAVRGNGE